VGKEREREEKRFLSQIYLLNACGSK
jgi:hypothetical protein